MALIWEGNVNTKLSYRIDSTSQGNILSVVDKKTGDVKATTEVYVSNARIAASDDEVNSWDAIAASIVPSK
jgi:hypothetical protein